VASEVERQRADLLRYFDAHNLVADSERYELSVDGLHYFTAIAYRQTDPARNWTVCKIEIWELETQRILATYFSDSDTFGSAWLQRDGRDYLLLPEFSDGQSVFDVSQKTLHSHLDPDDRFLWLAIFPSPNGRRVAVGGCYWACPFEVRVYDLGRITELPYPLLFMQHGDFEAWVDDDQVRLVGGEVVAL